MPGVRVEGVSKHFGPLRVVDRISLTVADGTLVTLLGPSGCGKTTTLRMIAGLEQNDAGRIAIGDRVVSDPASGSFVQPERREIGMVFQSYAIWPHMTVFANVAYPLEVRRRPRPEIRERVRASLRLMEMESLADRPATALSGGQQQRVAIARALVAEPAVLLMDEPLSNLDAKLREQMRVELRALQQRLAITTLYVTHDQEEAMVLSDEIAVMHEGRILQVAPPEIVYTRPANRTVAAFVGMPNLLPARVREVSRAADGTLAGVDGDGWDGWCAGPDDLRPGEAITVIVRPEAIQLGRAARAQTWYRGAPRLGRGATSVGGYGGPVARPPIEWTGVVTQRFFRGTRHLYTVDAGPHRFHVDAPPDQSFAAGDHVTLTVAAAHTWAVRA